MRSECYNREEKSMKGSYGRKVRGAKYREWPTFYLFILTLTYQSPRHLSTPPVYLPSTCPSPTCQLYTYLSEGGRKEFLGVARSPGRLAQSRWARVMFLMYSFCSCVKRLDSCSQKRRLPVLSLAYWSAWGRKRWCYGREKGGIAVNI